MIDIEGDSDDSRVVLYLLDSEQGHPLLYWSFVGTELIQIGRAPDNEVVVTHPFVSRSHAYISFADRAWHVTAVSQQGIFYGSQKLTRLRLAHGLEFRVGPNGPFIRFGTAPKESAHASTYCSTPNVNLDLTVDSEKLEREVSLITEDGFFQRLQASVNRFRTPDAAGSNPATAPNAGPREPAEETKGFLATGLGKPGERK